MAEQSSNKLLTVTERQQLFASWSMFILADIIVLNLWVEHSSSIVIDSFTISILTAVVMRALLAVTFRLEHRVGEFFTRHPGTLSKILKFLTAWIILFLSKFVILEIIDIIFGEHVKLGGLLPFIALVITLVVVEKLIEVIYDRLGGPGDAEAIPEDA